MMRMFDDEQEVRLSTLVGVSEASRDVAAAGADAQHLLVELSIDDRRDDFDVIMM